jgi:hypothetical protein
MLVLLMKGIMEGVVEIGPVGMISVPSSMTIGSGI